MLVEAIRSRLNVFCDIIMKVVLYIFAINLTRITSNIDMTLNTDINHKLFYINTVSAVAWNIK